MSIFQYPVEHKNLFLTTCLFSICYDVTKSYFRLFTISSYHISFNIFNIIMDHTECKNFNSMTFFKTKINTI